MREKIVIGNWKMNNNLEEGIKLIKDLNQLVENEKTIVCVPFTHLTKLHSCAKENIAIGAQNVAKQESGAFTGEVSASMIQSTGIKYVIVGHSERRTYFNEQNEDINLKVKQALKHNLKPIICCGENLELRESNKHLDFIKSQISSALEGLSKEDLANCIIAYEPIWAIGTGKTASAQQAQDVHAFIREELSKLYDNNTSENMTILYGGSVKPANAKELFSEKDIDGALVGGASLKATDFYQIIKSL